MICSSSSTGVKNSISSTNSSRISSGSNSSSRSSGRSRNIGKMDGRQSFNFSIFLDFIEFLEKNLDQIIKNYIPKIENSTFQYFFAIFFCIQLPIFITVAPSYQLQ